jgi:NAD(P)H-flavin reductase
MHRILTRDDLAPGVVRFWIEARHVARHAQPGQFVIVRLHEGGERIPLTIADASSPVGAVALIVQTAGKTTRKMNAMQPGEVLLDVAGPLGRPTAIAPRRRVCCVGGGIGAAGVLPIARGFTRAGGHVTTILAARSRRFLILEAEAREAGDVCLVTTDDGSYGDRGLAPDALARAIASTAEPFDEVVAVGPLTMMRAICELTRPLGLKTTVSLNPVMVDGTGMCGGCRVTVGGVQKFACVDGPEFDGHAVDFDELAARLAAYADDEACAAARWIAPGLAADGEPDVVKAR